MATLTNIKIKEAGAIIATATKGDSGIKDSIVTLQGVQWKVTKPADYVKKQVEVQATISRLGEGEKPFTKNMYITRADDKTVGLNAERPAAAAH